MMATIKPGPDPYILMYSTKLTMIAAGVAATGFVATGVGLLVAEVDDTAGARGGCTGTSGGWRAHRSSRVTRHRPTEMTKRPGPR